MGNCLSPPEQSSEEYRLEQTLNQIACRTGDIEYEDPRVKAWRDQWERVSGVTGGVYGEQGKPVDYLYVLPQVPSGRHDFERVYNEPEKIWLLRDPATGERGPRMGDVGLEVNDNVLKASYSASVGERDQRGIVWTSDLEAANPTYLTTLCLPKSVNAGGYDELVLRWPMSNWAATPEVIRKGMLITLADKNNKFKEMLKEADFLRIHQDLDALIVRHDQLKRMRALEAQFKAKQAAWGYAHWGEVIAVFTDDSAYERENEETKLKEKLDGVCWVVCQPPAGTPFAKTALAWRFAWEAPWNDDAEKYGDSVLLNAAGRIDARDPRTDSHMQWQVMRLTPKAAKAVAAQVKELEEERAERIREGGEDDEQ